MSPRPATGLPLFLAQTHGLVHPDRGDLEQTVGRLLGLPVAADLWEEAILPTRTQPYRGADFDRLFIEGGLRWFGVGPGKIVLGFPEDRKTFVPTPPDEETASLVGRIFGDQGLEAGVPELSSRSGLGLAPLTEALWSLAWKGAVAATTFGPLRQGLRSGFRFDRGTEAGTPRAPSGGFQRWASARSSSGTWRRWPPDPAKTGSGVEDLEEAKRRARLVLDRYGIVFRALLTHEGPSFQWKVLFPALRLMELSGEILGGLFWEGIPGLQFASPQALRDWEAAGDETAVWIQHAQDPSSLCGLGLEALGPLPRRTSGTWLWWQGPTLVATLGATGKKLDVQAFPLPSEEGISLIKVLVKRMAGILLSDGKTHWSIETIDSQPAADHPVASALKEAGFRPHGEKLIYWKS